MEGFAIDKGDALWKIRNYANIIRKSKDKAGKKTRWTYVDENGRRHFIYKHWATGTYSEEI